MITETLLLLELKLKLLLSPLLLGCRVRVAVARLQGGRRHGARWRRRRGVAAAEANVLHDELGDRGRKPTLQLLDKDNSVRREAWRASEASVELGWIKLH